MQRARFLFVLLAYLLASSAHSQTFQRAYGSGKSMQAFCVKQTSDGGFIVCGNIKLDSANTDIYLLKTNASGDTLWMKYYGGPLGEYEGIVQQTTDGGYVFTGSTHSSGAGEGDILVVKTDANGNTLWTRTYGGPGDEIGQSIQQIFDGGYIIGGHTDSFGAKGDMYMIRTNSLGDTLWTRNYGGAQHDHGFCVQQTSDSGFVLAGHSVSFGSNGGFFALRTDRNGDTLWTRGYGGGSDSYCYYILPTVDGGSLLTGTTTSFGIGGIEAMVVKIDALGDTLWTRTYGTPGDEYFNCIAPAAGGYLLAGSTSNGVDSSEVYVVKIDMNGDTLWTRTFGGLKDDEALFADACSDGGSIICGLSRSMLNGNSDLYLLRLDQFGNAGCAGRRITTVITKPDSVMQRAVTYVLAPATQVAGAAVSTNSSALNITDVCSVFGVETFSDDERLQLYPCPLTDQLIIHSESEIGPIRIFDAFGRICLETKVTDHETHLDMRHLCSGCYIAEIGKRHYRIVKQ